MTNDVNTGESVILDSDGLSALLKVIKDAGYKLIGPRESQSAIILDDIASIDDLPRGVHAMQEPGSYTLAHTDDSTLFDYNVGPESWKKYLFPERHRLWSAHLDDNRIVPEEVTVEPPVFAFLGVRACDIAAIEIQDRVFLESHYKDTTYASRRERALIIAVNCTSSAATCFCVSMDTGPRAVSGYDLALTEIEEEGSCSYLLEVGTERGGGLLQNMSHQPPTADHIASAGRMIDGAAESQQRHLDTSSLAALLSLDAEHPRWDEVAERCLTCGNCTLVCPTCFCNRTEDHTDLAGKHAERWRLWDSCFTLDFSWLASGSIRTTGKSRYRQWLTHKLSTWNEQFGTSGCVGCGRCISWCPVGIDLVEEANAIAASRSLTGDAA